MTEKSNDLSDKDKVTQASNSGEAKGIDKNNNSEANEEIASDQISDAESDSDNSSDEATKVDSSKVEDEVDTTVASEELIKEDTSNDDVAEVVESTETTEPVATDDTGTKANSAVDEGLEEKIEDKSNSNKPVEAIANEDDESEDESEEEHHEEEVDITSLSKIELVAFLKSKVKQDNIYRVDKIVHEIKAAFDDFTLKEKEEALVNFKAEGGVEDDFDFRPSDEEKEFNTYYFEYRHQLGALRKEAEKQKETNFTAKTELLNKLRELVDGEETTLSMSTIKGLQEEWKSIGPVPPSQNRNLWASYNALMDRFYDNRSIYFELKELDRKKNLESKLELVEKATALKDVKDLKDAIKALNDLHEEFKHIGPVPRDEQEALWQKFKGASDAVYDRRKDFYEGQKEVYKVNQDQKEALIEILKPFAEFKADRIRDWNSKTKEILDIQKKWEKIGPVPRETGKDINKLFWAAFKQFFHNKNLFFKELDEIRATNQGRAEELITKAEELKDNTDWQNTSNALVKLQQDWKKLGPTPEKNRDSLYKRFKLACDTFFDNRRDSNKQSTAEFEENLVSKQAICTQLTDAATSGEVSEEALTKLVGEFNDLGFVPRKAMKEIQAKFKTAVDLYLEKLSPEGAGREDFLFRLNLNRLQSDPNAVKTLNKKEHGIRKQVSELENNITLWKNNLEFFAASKTADKLKDQFDLKIQKAEEEIEKLKSKLSILKEF
ncbi:uncharacterized protein DUF349 [Algoriphagus ratkowskyi]|uniref:DUF349 domain-containing protein n=1 Tax=Algoriphagus ratkowskyi TaxID=57028 RepID=A0A2W7RCW6_9BACT|nr:DUF349 domain-containing protein [Algoriphagus ratkowskyi]PZX56966.1 uncharacterized protein DUF349 [Algoriphagus ratkowskyi]TXD79874.1 DUF349 domain-containing protein [Algoriphagus ratkowskyi]